MLIYLAALSYGNGSDLWCRADPSCTGTLIQYIGAFLSFCHPKQRE